MKTKHITGGKVDILLVEGLVQNQRPADVSSEIGYDWEFLSTIENLTEEQAVLLVNETQLYEPWTQYPPETLYYDYKTNEFCRNYTAKESFTTLLQSNGVMFENPVKISTESYTEAADDFKRYDMADKNVFNPKTTLIFTKTK